MHMSVLTMHQLDFKRESKDRMLKAKYVVLGGARTTKFDTSRCVIHYLVKQNQLQNSSIFYQ
jgi:hypothetical protein